MPVWFFLEPRTTAGKEWLIHREFLPLTEVWAKSGGDKPGGNATSDQGVSPVRWGASSCVSSPIAQTGADLLGLAEGSEGEPP